MSRTGKAANALKVVRLDLHIHTVVSACAEVEMIPPLIVQRALALGLDWIAITDHNTVENVEVVQRAARGTPLEVLPGMEVQTREEVHILSLFDTMAQAWQWQEIIYAALPAERNRPEVFGPQFVVDETGEFVRSNERLLLTSVALSLEDVVKRTRDLGGIALAAHVDRPSYSLLANLGFVPAGLPLSGLEISRFATVEEISRQYPEVNQWPLISSSDAHRLAEMTVRTAARLANRTVEELELALSGKEGRSVWLLSGGDPLKS